MLNILRLSGILGVAQADELRQQLLEQFKSNPAPLTLNLGAVMSVDTAVIQLLVALKLQQPKTKIVDCPDDIVESFDRLGVMRLLL